MNRVPIISEQNKTPQSNRKIFENNHCPSLTREVKTVEFFLDINHQKQEEDSLNIVITGK